MKTPKRHTTRNAAAALLAAVGLGLAGCGTEGPETGTDVEDVTDGEIAETSPAATNGAGVLAYEGEYNQEFYDTTPTYVGQQVTVSAEVSEVLSPDTFAIAGAVDPLLIVEEGEVPSVDEGQVIQVTGTVQKEFSVTAVEDELGVELDDAMFTDYEGDPYIMATRGEIIEQE